MGHLTLHSEYSFGACYGFLNRLVNEYSDDGFIGICDNFNTFSAYRLQEACRKHNENLTDWTDGQAYNPIQKGARKSKAKFIKPIFGIRVTVVEDASIDNSRTFGRVGQHGTEYIVIAKNQDGIREIFKLTSIGSSNFFYRENVSASDIDNLTENVYVIPTSNIITDRADYYGLTFFNRDSLPVYLKTDKHRALPLVAIDENFYPTKEDKNVYECFAGRKRDTRSFPQYILEEDEQRYYYPKEAVDNIKVIADSIEFFELPRAKPIKAINSDTIENLIIKGAKKKGIDLSVEPYSSRIESELKIMHDKNFIDYFLVMADVIQWAKKRMLVAPGRGSSAGSLVCHCLDITDLDPLKYDLVFERFISPERSDFPDIDSDFNDKKRIKVVQYMEKTYGKEKVKTIANIITFKPKSAIGEFAKALRIPEWKTEATKDSILDRAGGDNRASFCMEDTFTETEPGRQLLKEHPELGLVMFIEGHAKNKGKHAAGVIISNEPLTNFCGVDNRYDTIHMNKYDAEAINLLKVDILGLRTLSVLEDTAELSGFKATDFYKIDLEEETTYEIFEDQRLSGIFQFEGATMNRLNQEVPMECFDDIAASQALARPGALSSGGTTKYINIKNGKKEAFYYSDVHKDITKSTFGIIVYQEQMMRVAREMANFTWSDVGRLRKAASKSMGDEYFSTFKPKFIEGCQDFGGLTEEMSEKLWKDVASSGSYSFNLSHAVSYGVISNWCAWAKKNHGLQFVASILNNSKTDKDSLKVLREFYDNEGLQYESVNPDTSEVRWSIQDGKLVGGLGNIDGFGPQKAKDAIKMRNGEKPFTPSVLSTMFEPTTPYDILFPADFHWYDIYNNPYEYTEERTKVSYLKDIQKKKEYWCIGQIIYFDDINLNDYVHIQKRGNEITDGFDRKIVFRVEDDTDIMTMIVSRFDYPGLRDILTKCKIDKTWLLIKGEIIFPNARIFMAKQIANISEQIGLQPYNIDTAKFSKIRRVKR